jgi:hypothetical protein
MADHTDLWQTLASLPGAIGGLYRLTERGRDVAAQIEGAAQTKLAALHPLPADDLAHLDELLGRLVAACLANPNVPEKWCVVTTNNAGPNHEPAPLGRIAKSAYALSVYRCDCHLAAWRPHGLRGPAWEALTLLWRGEADGPAALHA